MNWRRAAMTVESLAGSWRSRAGKLRDWAAAEEVAHAWEEAARELEAVLASVEQELLNLQQASDRSGYSPDHLGRLIRDGKLPNSGRVNAPKIRVGDLPRKPGQIPARTAAQQTRQAKKAIARALLKAVSAV
jgi:hypothetical protein